MLIGVGRKGLKEALREDSWIVRLPRIEEPFDVETIEESIFVVGKGGERTYVYMSEDWGETWRLIYDTYEPLDFRLSRYNDEIILHARRIGRIVILDKKGQQKHNITGTELPKPWVLTEDKEGNLYGGTYVYPGPEHRIFKSNDSGRTWRLLVDLRPYVEGLGFGSGTHIHMVKYDPHTDALLVTGGDNPWYVAMVGLDGSVKWITTIPMTLVGNRGHSLLDIHRVNEFVLFGSDTQPGGVLAGLVTATGFDHTWTAWSAGDSFSTSLDTTMFGGIFTDIPGVGLVTTSIRFPVIGVSKDYLTWRWVSIPGYMGTDGKVAYNKGFAYIPARPNIISVVSLKTLARITAIEPLQQVYILSHNYVHYLGDTWFGFIIPLYKFRTAKLYITYDRATTYHVRLYDTPFTRSYMEVKTFSPTAGGQTVIDASGYGGIGFNPYTNGVKYSAILVCHR